MSFEEACQSVQTQLEQFRIVPVLAFDSVADGIRMGEILHSQGLPVAEITFRTEAAEDVIRELNTRFRDLCVGAGTVLNVQDLHRAFDAGAEFAVAPGFNPDIVREAIAHDFPFFPGVATPTEVEQAIALGCRILKFFPAEAAGGTQMLKSIIAPYKHLGIRFVPTGGISPANLHAYLSIPQVVAVGGTWLGKTELIRSGAWEQIRGLVTEAACAGRTPP